MRPPPLVLLLAVVADAGDRRRRRAPRRRFGWKSPAVRPRRSTTIRSATSKTSARLWLITTTPSPRSRRRLISSSTWAVWGTPSAAVGSSSITTLGSPSSDRATATCWRWPPESVPTSVRTLGIVTARFRAARRPVLHPRLVELAGDRPGPAGPPRGRGRCWPRRRGCRRGRGPGRRSRSRAPSRPGAA